MAIAHLSDSEFKQEVLESKKLSIVDFWAPWCAPCKMIAPILEDISREYDARLTIYKINIDENVLYNFREFIIAKNRYAKLTADQAKPFFTKRFGNTYWYYYFFL